MDGALSSSRAGGGGGHSPSSSYSRHDNNNNNRYNNNNYGHNRNYHGGYGGGGGRRGRGGGRGYRGNRHRPYHGRYNNNRGGGDDRRFHGGRGGGGRHRGNRFPTQSAVVDPEKAMLDQLSAMVAKMGDWGSTSESLQNTAVQNDLANNNITQEENGMADSSEQELDTEVKKRQQVFDAITKNVKDLSSVLTNPQTAPTFLKYHSTVKTEETAAKTGEEGNEEKTEDVIIADSDSNISEEKKAGPLASLIVSCAYALPLQTSSYAALTMVVDKGVQSMEGYSGFANRCVNYACSRLHVDLLGICTRPPMEEDVSKNHQSSMECFYRCKFVLRYLAMLTKAGVVVVESNNEDSAMQDDNDDSESKMGMLDLLNWIIQKGNDLGDPYRTVLAHLVLSTIPYFLDSDTIQPSKLQLLFDSMPFNEYQSPYKPGKGILSVLLKEEPQDDDEDDENEDSDDDEDDDDDEGNEPVCDSLQELLKLNQKLLENSKEALLGTLTDAPWLHLSPSDDEEQMNDNESKPIYLNFDTTILDNSSDSSESSLFPPQYHIFSSVLHGRLPLNPSELDEDDEDEDEKQQNKQQTDYITTFNPSARTLLNDSIRDILYCHCPVVSASGVERGSTEDAAKQIWSLYLLFAPHSTKGVEYGIVECLLGLIAQSHHLYRTTSMVLSSVYISQVLLELIKLQPKKMSSALAVSVGILVENIIPSLVPESIFGLANWFAFHLVNTDFQWPKNHWQHWAELAQSSTSRKYFFQRVMCQMSALAGRETVLQSCCLSAESSLRQFLDNDRSQAVETVDLEKQLRDRMWNETELSTTLDEWITECEASLLDILKARDGVFWRARLVTRAILSPPKLRSDEFTDSNENENHPMDVDEGLDNFLPDLLLGIQRYAPLVISSLEKGLQNQSDTNEYNRTDAEAEICLQIQESVVEKRSRFTVHMQDAVYEAMLEQKVLTPLGLVKYVLSDENLTDKWYKLAGMGTEYAVKSIIYSISDGVASILDSENKVLKMNNTVSLVTDNLSPVLEFTCKHVCTTLMSSIASCMQPNSGKKLVLKKKMVYLIEGLKQTLWNGQIQCCKYLEGYFYEGQGKRLLGEVQLSVDDKKTISELLSDTIGAKRWRSVCEEVMADSEHRDLVLSWIDELIIA